MYPPGDLAASLAGEVEHRALCDTLPEPRRIRPDTARQVARDKRLARPRGSDQSRNGVPEDVVVHDRGKRRRFDLVDTVETNRGPGLRARHHCGRHTKPLLCTSPKPKARPLGPGFIEPFELRIPHARSRSEEHPSELQSLKRISYADSCLQKH